MHGTRATSLLLLLTLFSLAGACGAPAPATPPLAEQRPAMQEKSAAPPRVAKAKPPAAAKVVAPAVAPEPSKKDEQAPSATSQRQPPAPVPALVAPQASEIDEERVRSQGIRKLSGKRLTLYTDLPVDDEIASLPEAFEQAFPQWREYFGVTTADDAAWRAVGRLMKDEAKFRAAGLMPDDLPQFGFGYSRGNDLWWREQPSAYYRRHLMLHEGTHWFMFARFGTCGPPWYMEGMAELLATHSWIDGKLELNVFPARREAVPYWGRVKIVRDDVARGHSYRLEEVLAFAPGLHSTVEPYGWCWATAAFLDGHPRYRERFRRLPAELKADDFNRRMRALYADDWDELDEEWQCYILALEYGYDLVRNAIDFVPGKALSDAGARVTVAADRGWQSTGIRVEAGKKYSLRASGRYQLGQQPQIWWSEPNGVSLRYYGGRPLGLLMAAVHPEPYDSAAVSSLLSPIVVGLHAELEPAESGTLYLRINDSPAELADNVGNAEVEISAE